MDIDKLRLLVKISEYNNLTKAAESLGYTQSAASYIIASLEKELGVKLLHRTKKGVTLNSNGLSLITAIKNCVIDADILFESARFLQGLQSGYLRIAAFSSVTLAWLPEIIWHFHDSYPNIKLDIISGTGTYSEMEEYLLSGKVDCSFVILPTSEKFNYKVLRDDPLKLILPKRHPLTAIDRPITFQELKDIPFILPAKEKDIEINSLCDQFGFTPHVAFTMSDDVSTLCMVEKNLGCTIASELMLKPFHFQVEAKELEGAPHREIALATLDNRKLSPLINAFFESVEQTLITHHL